MPKMALQAARTRAAATTAPGRVREASARMTAQG
jgi:hypothetical protein